MYTEHAIIFSKYTIYAMIIFFTIIIQQQSGAGIYALGPVFCPRPKQSRHSIHKYTVIAMHILQLCQLV